MSLISNAIQVTPLGKIMKVLRGRKQQIEYRLMLELFKGFKIHVKIELIGNCLYLRPFTFYLNENRNDQSRYETNLFGTELEVPSDQRV